MNKYYPNLFSPIYIGKTRLKNRIEMCIRDRYNTFILGSVGTGIERYITNYRADRERRVKNEKSCFGYSRK